MLLTIVLIGEILLANLVYCGIQNQSIRYEENAIEKCSLYLKQLQDNKINELENVNQTLNHHKYRKDPILNSVDVKKIIFSSENFEDTYSFFFEMDKHQGKREFSHIGRMGMIAKLQSSIYHDLLIHHYDNLDELNQSGGPEANQELCLNQLEYFIDRTKQLKSDEVRTKDIDFFRLIDSFGRVSAGMMTGNVVWLGEYDECSKINIFGSNNEEIKTRYCISHIKLNFWSNDDKVTDLMALKKGVCLPKSCDSRNYKNKYELVENLHRIADESYNPDFFRLESLYCLPDEQSSIRTLFYNQKAVITLICFTTWIAIIVYATYEYEKSLNDKSETTTNRDDTSSINLNGKEKLVREWNDRDEKLKDRRMELYKVLSITVNAKNLFNINKKSSLILNIEEDNSKQAIDLSSLEGIKAISMFYIVISHVLMCMTMISQNARDTGDAKSIAWLIANSTPAFAVNTFFCITGLLTSYFVFKTGKIEVFTNKPIQWISLIIYRYLRIFPIYLIVVLYLKNLAKFTGSGPLWDYGTSPIGQRKMCEQESILWTVLMISNFKNPLEHCIPPAWYLSNDIQFFIVTPIFLTALHKNHKFGTILLIFSTIASYLANLSNIYLNDFDNIEAIANYMPHYLNVVTTFFSHNYARPYYRITAYLIGLLAGFYLYKHENDKAIFESTKQTSRKKCECSEGGQLNCAQKVAKIDQNYETQVNKDVAEIDKTPDWPETFKRFGLPLAAYFVLLCFISPPIGTSINFNKFYARCGVSFVMSTFHIFIASATAIYILLTSTGHGNKTITNILASPRWKPLNRLGLCIVLVNVEVINYFIQTTSHTYHINDRVFFVLSLGFIFITFAVATVVCILFEAPLRGVLNLALSRVLSRLTASEQNRAKSE